MSGFYDCWDLGGLDTTLNSYLADIRAPKQPADIAPAAPAPTQPAAIVSAPQPQSQSPPGGTSAAFTNYTHVPVKKQKPEMVELVLRAMLSPIACIFLWMLCVVLATALMSRKKHKKRKYKRLPYEMYRYNMPVGHERAL